MNQTCELLNKRIDEELLWPSPTNIELKKYTRARQHGSFQKATHTQQQQFIKQALVVLVFLPPPFNCKKNPPEQGSRADQQVMLWEAGELLRKPPTHGTPFLSLLALPAPPLTLLEKLLLPPPHLAAVTSSALSSCLSRAHARLNWDT